MSELDDALDQSRRLIEGALGQARSELEELRVRVQELEAQIARAEATLGTPASAPSTASMTLHDAMAKVLRENGNDWMTARELVDALAAEGLYRMRDGRPADMNQVHARTGNYTELFEKEGSNIRLREESKMLTDRPQTVTLFRDDDAGFLSWLERHPEGYFINADRSPRPTYLVLHLPSCPHFKGGSDVHWTKAYVKLCSLSRDDLAAWATDTVGGEPTLCGSCFG